MRRACVLEPTIVECLREGVSDWRMLQRAGEERGEGIEVTEARTHGPVSLLCVTLRRFGMDIDMSFDISGRDGFGFNLLTVPYQRIGPRCHDYAR
eukprot:14847963-Alexandrium_andersonii.AAC.1